MDFANEFKEMRREIRDLKTATPNSGGGGGSYTAGDGIDITDNEISVDSTIARTADIKNGRLTIQHNSETVQTFTANQEPDSTANIETIYAEDVVDVEEVAPITTGMIQDGAVTTSKIRDYAINASKLNFGTLYRSASDITSTISIPANTETRIQTLTLPAGTWLVLWGIRFTAATTSAGITYTNLKDSSGILQSCHVNEIIVGGYIRQTVAGNYQLTTTTSRTIYTTLETAASNANVAANNPTFLRAIRVG